MKIDKKINKLQYRIENLSLLANECVATINEIKKEQERHTKINIKAYIQDNLDFAINGYEFGEDLYPNYCAWCEHYEVEKLSKNEFCKKAPAIFEKFTNIGCGMKNVELFLNENVDTAIECYCENINMYDMYLDWCISKNLEFVGHEEFDYKVEKICPQLKANKVSNGELLYAKICAFISGCIAKGLSNLSIKQRVKNYVLNEYPGIKETEITKCENFADAFTEMHDTKQSFLDCCKKMYGEV